MFEIRDGRLTFTAAGLPPGAHHVSATYDGTDIRVYVDGRRYPPAQEEA